METFKHSVCELHGVTGVLGVWIEDHEFVAGDAADKTAMGKSITQPLCDRNQHGITRLVPQRIIDVFEAIYVNE